MAARHDVRFIHNVEEEAVTVTTELTENGRIAAAAARTDEEHNRSRNGQASPFDAKALGPRRVESQGSRRIINEVRRRNEFSRDVVAAAFY